MQKQIIVSGMRPTGLLHLGHYFGVLRNWVVLQNKYQCYFFVADWHSLTTEYDHVDIVQSSLKEMVLDWLACDVSPEKCVLFVQSKVPEHAELHLLFSMITPLGWLERVPSYKEIQQQLTGKDLSTYGFLGYPLLQTADVAIYKAHKVPVGQDQVAHIELSREVVRRFNHLYKDIFPEPETFLTTVPKVPGTDGRKMSKSYQNCIYLSDDEKTFNDKLLKHITDPARQRRTDPGNPDICPIYAYHKEVSSKEEIGQVNLDCRTAKIGCIDCKKILIKNMTETFKPFREKRNELKKDPKIIGDILAEGAKKARMVAGQTLAEANEAMGLS
ncbi:MAG TPA: tryptophan--tRNA ligase [Deltaproteobacteria bacterium]|nr:MAG: tryptophan--tRNA ligase [Deltaproteobacteria bacterium GWA2_45_12]HBF13493.1 tryptophan--tRNA ligase [Deltaproteobacteria bacterium]